MQITQVVELYNFCLSFKTKKMPIKTAYKFTKLVSLIEPEVNFYREKFQELINEYAVIENNTYKLSEDKTSILIKENFEEECNAKITELQSIDIDLSNFTFSIEELGDINLSMEEMKILLPLITD